MNFTSNPIYSFNTFIPNNPNNITNFPLNPTNSTHNISNSNYKNLITISTLNVRGFNDKTKLTSLLNNITNDRSIICCSETKNTQHNPLPTKMNYKTIISSIPNSSASNGASIILTKSITNHIFKTFSLNEFWCAIHLKFKPKIDIIIISCYLPHDPILRKKAVKSLRDFIRQHTNKHMIIAGDFNSFPNSAPSINALSPPFKKQIYNYLHNFTDIAKATNKEHNFTHFTNTSASRIDQIWITNNLASKILSYKVSD
jgi:exonuclease III